MTAASLLDELRALGVCLYLDNEQVGYRAPKGVMTPDRLARVARRKPELAALLADDLTPRRWPIDWCEELRLESAWLRQKAAAMADPTLRQQARALADEPVPDEPTFLRWGRRLVALAVALAESNRPPDSPVSDAHGDAWEHPADRLVSIDPLDAEPHVDARGGR